MEKCKMLMVVLAVFLFSSPTWSGESCCATASENQAGSKQTANPPKSYPLDTCIVSDLKLGSMGEPVVYVHDGQEVKFCCAGCIQKFKADPETYLKKIKDKGTGAAPQGTMK